MRQVSCAEGSIGRITAACGVVAERFALGKGFSDTPRVLTLVENGDHRGYVLFDDVVGGVVAVVQHEASEMKVFGGCNFGI